MASGRYRDRNLDADVHIRVSGNSRRISASWKGPELRVNIPKYLTANQLENFIQANAARLIELRPSTTHYPGRVIDAPDVDIAICESTPLPGQSDVSVRTVLGNAVHGKVFNYYIDVAPHVAAHIADTAVQRTINEAVLRCARHASQRLVLPLARRIAAKIGRAPLGWEIKHTLRRLGSCSPQGVITLDPRLIFLTEDLRRFIICHELAHLSEMNHSAAFHNLCNRYLDGREDELNARLRNVKFPVF